MRRFRKAAILGGLLALLAVGATLVWRRLHTPLPPLEVGLWYWHEPFHIPPAEAAQWRALGVTQIFVHAGEFHWEKGKAGLILPQRWETAPAEMKLHLVFRFDASLIRNFSTLDLAALTASLQEGIQSERNQATKTGAQVVGVQLDFDCPTRLLPRYAELLKRLRAVLPPKTVLSATALPTWYTGDSIRSLEGVAAAVDFLAPQYYEGVIPEHLDRFATISRLSMAEHGMQAAGRLGYPFYVGIPAYGHALLYDQKGVLQATLHDMSAPVLLRDSRFRLLRAFPADKEGRPATGSTYVGEDIYDFVALQPDRYGRGLGYHLVYDLPTPALLEQHLALVRAQRPRNCLGVLLFRYPEAGETSTLPLPTLAAALQNRPTRPDLKVRIKAETLPWEMIDTGRKVERSPMEVTILVTNTGAAGTFLASDAVTLDLAFNQPGFEEIDRHDFEQEESSYSGDLTPEHAVRSSALRANLLRFQKSSLAPGETARIGPIRIPADGATQLSGHWTLVGPGRLQTYRGDIPSTDLTPSRSAKPALSNSGGLP